MELDGIVMLVEEIAGHEVIYFIPEMEVYDYAYLRKIKLGGIVLNEGHPYVLADEWFPLTGTEDYLYLILQKLLGYKQWLYHKHLN